jgi:N-acyl-D-amino-acid deacylase
VRDKKLISLEEAIRKMTSLPAQNLGINNRGMLKNGNFADIVIFDPDRIIDHATYTKPHQFPSGIDYVLVNGHVVVKKGKHTGALPGKAIFR